MQPRAGVVACVAGRVLLARGRARVGVRRLLARPRALARWRALAGFRPLLAGRQARTAPPVACLMIPDSTGLLPGSLAREMGSSAEGGERMYRIVTALCLECPR